VHPFKTGNHKSTPTAGTAASTKPGAPAASTKPGAPAASTKPGGARTVPTPGAPRGTKRPFYDPDEENDEPSEPELEAARDPAPVTDLKIGDMVLTMREDNDEPTVAQVDDIDEDGGDVALRWYTQHKATTKLPIFFWRWLPAFKNPETGVIVQAARTSRTAVPCVFPTDRARIKYKFDAVNEDGLLPDDARNQLLLLLRQRPSN
jgi:hypothetical protein